VSQSCCYRDNYYLSVYTLSVYTLSDFFRYVVVCGVVLCGIASWVAAKISGKHSGEVYVGVRVSVLAQPKGIRACWLFSNWCKGNPTRRRGKVCSILCLLHIRLLFSS
jgi:hypothetical protein